MVIFEFCGETYYHSFPLLRSVSPVSSRKLFFAQTNSEYQNREKYKCFSGVDDDVTRLELALTSLWIWYEPATFWIWPALFFPFLSRPIRCTHRFIYFCSKKKIFRECFLSSQYIFFVIITITILHECYQEKEIFCRSLEHTITSNDEYRSNSPFPLILKEKSNTWWAKVCKFFPSIFSLLFSDVVVSAFFCWAQHINQEWRSDKGYFSRGKNSFRLRSKRKKRYLEKKVFRWITRIVWYYGKK